ncbi:hypothetical protein Ae201684P_003251 [Aphanomyces euteiches]|uniref:EF-hand domain-containing protein n=1 Tax=Aphanomyces euteiches TaxID=100861 RepID=A0A6G0W6V3_9STRA|nr:hypothetical protein Ae201684_018850 [Aphanomyces euteiches]KAH9073748.1 hypothetical protein Ae201684P_003251 [Aphanomyces euteiches]KAH9144633.1 hypothetical protein AeRB84_011436 [Aphanomyces euteiches]
MQVLRALSTIRVEDLFSDHLFGHDPAAPSEADLLALAAPEASPQSTSETREERLFELFTAYAMQFSSEDPTSIRLVNVLKLLHDCGVVADTIATSSASEGHPAKELTIRQVEIIASKLLHTSTTCTKLTYDDFLKLLWDLALHVDPDAATPAAAFKQLVDQCVHRPPTKARARVSVESVYKQTDKVLTFFEPGLLEIFKCYADATHQTRCQQRNKLKKTPSSCAGSPSVKKVSKRPPAPNMALYLNYHDSVAFARKFGLVSHGGVTVAEFAASYIDSVEKINHTTFRQLTYLGFCHLLVRLAMRLYAAAATPETQLKALFQFMWLNSLDAPRAETTALCGRRDHSSARQAEGTATFRALFLKQWKRDSYIDYTAKGDAAPSGAVVGRKTAMKQALLEPPTSTLVTCSY